MTNGEKIKEIFPDTKIITQYDNPFGDRFMVFTLNNEHMEVNIDWWNAEYKEPTNTIDYRRAFKIACDLLNGDILYGVDTDKIYEIMMQKDDVVSSSSYEEYILNHLQELDKGQYANETDSTTRNCFGCKYATDNHNSGTEECHLCMWENQYTPTPKNDLGVDCISRQAVLDLINADWKYENLEIEINNLPSVTPQEPRKGHWIESMPEGAEEWCYKCSECNFWKYKKTINLSKFKFCPNCGSRNEVEE